MNSFQVTPASQTGHRDIDAQVHTLFSIANEVLFAKELETSPILFQRALKFFVAYLDYHFASEEIAMAQSHYPARHLHSDFHAHVLHEATVIVERRSREGSLAEAKHAVFCMVEDWLYYHVKEADRHFADFLRETPANQEIPRLPGIRDLRASGVLSGDFDEPMLKRLGELGHLEPSSWRSSVNEKTAPAESDKSTGA